MDAAASARPPLSLDDFRHHLQDHLRTSGALSTLKSQLRGFVLHSVAERRAGAGAAAAGGRGAAGTPLGRLADAVVAAHLRHGGRRWALDVFRAEAAVGDADDADVAAAVGVGAAEGGAGPLVALLAAHADRRRVGGPSAEAAVQTEEERVPLEQRLARIDAQCALRLASGDVALRVDLEGKLASIRQEVEEQMKREVSVQVQQVRAKEILEARRAEEMKYQTMLRHKQEEFAELERTLQQKISLERQRLEQSRIELDVDRAQVEKRVQEAAQRVREQDEAIGLCEIQLKEQRDHRRVLEHRLAQYEELCSSRLQELERCRAREQRRIDEIQRITAEHALEVRAKEDEIMALRYRLKGLECNPAASRRLSATLDRPLSQPQEMHRLTTSGEFAYPVDPAARIVKRDSAKSLVIDPPIEMARDLPKGAAKEVAAYDSPTDAKRVTSEVARPLDASERRSPSFTKVPDTAPKESSTTSGRSPSPTVDSPSMADSPMSAKAPPSAKGTPAKARPVIDLKAQQTAMQKARLDVESVETTARADIVAACADGRRSLWEACESSVRVAREEEEDTARRSVAWAEKNARPALRRPSAAAAPAVIVADTLWHRSDSDEDDNILFRQGSDEDF